MAEERTRELSRCLVARLRALGTGGFGLQDRATLNRVAACLAI